MLAADRLTIMHSDAPNASGFESFDEIAVNQAGHVVQRSAYGTGKRRFQVGWLAGLLRIHANHVQEAINLGAQFLQAGFMLRGDNMDREASAEKLLDEFEPVCRSGQINLIGNNHSLDVL